nr:MAG TPA: hypothetical protein [Caudoviricetes sp.]DAT30869.1 MAG TPA: hypothetical protein [Bacteriophage sp.]
MERSKDSKKHEPPKRLAWVALSAGRTCSPTTAIKMQCKYISTNS